MSFSINETMGQYSELFMLLAAGTYTVAFIAFAWDLAKSSKMLRAVDLKAAELSGAAARPMPRAFPSASVRGPPEPTSTAPMRTSAALQAVPSVRRRPPPARAPPQVRARPPTAACATPASGVPPPGWPSR